MIFQAKFTALLLISGLVTGATVTAHTSQSDGEAPEPSKNSAQIVVGDSQYITEEERTYDFIVAAALAEDEPPPATQGLTDIEGALNIGDLRLISSKTEMMTPDHRREESMYLMTDGSVLTIWWQEIDPEWDVMGGEELLAGWPTGVAASINNKRDFIQVLFSDGAVHGSVVVEEDFNNPGARPGLSSRQTVDFARAMYESLTLGK
ncbi:hypothetical protein MNBD_ACTINO02-3251 [hydrothermal vent metagenome]|uniref:Uncharacterized protein n=1 Tax=hydrothermal vent metagenome TaxID=652676 RepID=A0A3B0SPA0_9ZZZZ